MKLRVAGRILVKGTWWNLDQPVLEARLLGSRVIVILGGGSSPDGADESNLVAFDLKQERLWVAGNPTGQAADRYTGFLSESPLKVANSSGLGCQIDIETGQIKKILFTR